MHLGTLKDISTSLQLKWLIISTRNLPFSCPCMRWISTTRGVHQYGSMEVWKAAAFQAYSLTRLLPRSNVFHFLGIKSGLDGRFPLFFFFLCPVDCTFTVQFYYFPIESFSSSRTLFMAIKANALSEAARHTLLGHDDPT